MEVTGTYAFPLNTILESCNFIRVVLSNGRFTCSAARHGCQAALDEFTGQFRDVNQKCDV